jgi:phosphotransferase family enzyme
MERADMRRAAPIGAHAAAPRDGRSLPPADRAIPQLPGLLHPGAMVSVLERSLRSGTAIEDLRVRLFDYVPGVSATIAYDVAIAGARHVAVATAGHGRRPAAVRADARRVIARASGREWPVARPLTYDGRLGALVQWYPLDLAMPVLALPVAEVLRRAARAGIAVGGDGATTSTLVYRPGQRAVIRAGDVVLKAYAEDAEFRAGVAGLRIAGGLGLGTAPRLHGALPDLRLTVQSALDGTPVQRDRADEVAPIAGAMLRVLHGAAVPGLEIAPPERMLASAARAARLTAAVAPGLARRTLDLLARLEEHAPEIDELVPSHGDFNISQLLDVEGAMALLDFDEACLAPRALDVASYAANLVSGRPGDLARADAALAALLDGYGARPEGLHWYLAASLLRRAPSPFRLHKKRWIYRTEAIIGAAEAVFGQSGS